MSFPLFAVCTFSLVPVNTRLGRMSQRLLSKRFARRIRGFKTGVMHRLCPGGGLRVSELFQQGGKVKFHNCSSSVDGVEPQGQDETGRSFTRWTPFHRLLHSKHHHLLASGFDDQKSH